MQVDHPSAEMYAGGWSASFSDRSRDGPSGDEIVARGLAELEAAAPKAARVFLFLLPGGRPRRRGGKGVAAPVDAVFLLLPLGRPGPRFSGTPTSPGARAARVAAEGVVAAAAAAAGAAKVFLLRLPFGRPRFRDAGGVISGASAFFSLPSGISSPPTAEPLREVMAGLSSERRGPRRREKWECALDRERSQHLNRSGEGDGTRRFGNHPYIVCTYERATAAIATADRARN
jgi:hypothetical protein